MRLFDQLRMWARMIFLRSKAGAELDRELQAHLDLEIAQNIAAGMSAEAARTSAFRSFGNPALLRDQTKATWSWNWLESLLRDVRFGVRTLGRSPGFALVAILVMALGIGANIALFTVVRGVLLKPLPFRDPDKLVNIYENETTKHDFTQFMPVAGGSFFEWQRAVTGVEQMALVSPFQNYNVSAEGGKLPERVDAAWCSWTFFSVLGTQPMLGRTFTADDDQPSAQSTVVLSYAFWKRRYSADTSIVGKSIWLDAKPYTVLGVLPESFHYSGAFGGNTVTMWTPVSHEAPPFVLHTFADHEFLVIARLLPGTTAAGLMSQLQAVQKRIRAAHPEGGVHDSVNVRSMLDDAVHEYRTPLYVMLAATGCVLLIACLNVASLLIARTAARQKELAIRSALGCRRGRLFRERFIESLLLSLGGGGLGMLLAWGAVQWLVHIRHDMNRAEAIHIDGTVAAFSIGIIVFCASLAGVISAMSIGSRKVLGSLQDSSRTQSAGRARAGLRKSLLVLEVGLTVVLLVGAGLLLKSYARMVNTDVGVPTDNVLTMRISLPDARYKTPVQQVAFFERVITEVRAVPGVQGAGLVSVAPGEGWGGDHLMAVVEHPPVVKGLETDVMVRGADPGYFAAIHLPLLRGRLFTSEERLKRDHVVVISESTAKLLFPGEDPIGKHLRTDLTGDVYEVLGVVGNTRWQVSQPMPATLYWPIYGNGYSGATIVVRSSSNVDALDNPVQRIIGRLDPDLPVSDVTTLREAIGKSTVDSQFDSILVVAFAVIALALAAAGLYGVLAYLVAQRTGEIGIRIALGAQRAQVVRLTIFDGLRPALLGLALGLLAAGAVVRFIRSMLYETQPLDASVFAGVAATLLLVAALACLVPAWRASRLDPVQALRTE